MKRKLQSQQGVAALIALLMLAMLTLIGLAAISTSDDEMSIAGNELQEMRAFYAAEAGLERVASVLNTEYDSTGLPPTTLPNGEDTINMCVVSYSATDDGAATMRTLEVGTLAGLHALVKSFTVSSTAYSEVDKQRIRMSESFETALVPIFQFAVFYGNDLEIAPGPDMNLIGRVHSNGDLYVQSNNNLYMDSYVTASGDIYHGRKGPGGAGYGDVQIRDADGNYVSMQDGAGWLDASDADWYDSSVVRWDGRVQDASHGQEELNVPLTGGSDPHALIERDDGSNPDSYQNLATLRIIDGTATQQQSDGTWLDVTASMVSDGVLTYTNNQFTDQREGRSVDCTEIDIEAMYDNGYAPRNGVVYFSDSISSSYDWPALRLVNGDELDDGLTVASENPVYTLGDYNSVNKQPAAILADAVTFLSNNWNDANSNLNKWNRPASSTTVNCSYLTGNVETTSTDYNGGFENLPRFLESWSGRDFHWKGSAVNLWNSTQAYGTWNGSYYDPPNRDWLYDTDLDDPTNLPPETPMVRIFQRTGWHQDFVSYYDRSAYASDGSVTEDAF